MAATAARTTQQRKTDATQRLHERHADVWVATASGDSAHLVPLSYHWDGHRMVLVTDPSSATARNLTKSRTARLALGGTRDVVMIDARLDEVLTLEDAPSTLLDAYATQADWDPRLSDEPFVVLLLAPKRIQAWREADEIAGRTLMRDGEWLV